MSLEAKLAVVTLATLVALVATVSQRTWQALRRRQRVLLTPTESFAPSSESLERWCSALYATRRGWRSMWSRRGEAVRVRVDGAGTAAAVFAVEASSHAIAILRAALPADVEMSEPTDPQPLTHRKRWRAELVLAGKADHSLRELATDPDPLGPIVGALGALEGGEAATVVVDLQPVSSRARRARMRRSSRSEHRTEGGLTFGQALTADPLSPPRARTQSWWGQRPSVARREETVLDRERHAKVASHGPSFDAQVLVWADTADRRRSRHLVAVLVAGFAASNDRARWRRTGWGGVLGAQWCGWGFDLRAERGLFRPRRKSWVRSVEIAGYVKPPTAGVSEGRPDRTAGLVGAAPVGLVDWTPGAPGLFPVGIIRERGVSRTVGVSLDDSLFTLSSGRSGAGKTEAALIRALALVNEPSQPGVLFLDPHADALERMRGWLRPHASRVVEVDLSQRGAARMAGWNPLEMTGAGTDEIELRVEMVTAAFSVAMGWADERNARALNLVTQTTAALCELGLRLPPDLQPTLFQFTSLLSDTEWRSSVLGHLGETSRSFWLNRFPKLATEAVTPVTNLVDRLRQSRVVSALLGQPRSTFDLRRAVDSGGVVLLCPGAGDKEHLMGALMLFELHRVLASRRDLPVDQRRPVHAFVDEMQTFDVGRGADLIQRMCREARKFGGRLHGMVQQPDSLSADTLQAFLVNRSHLFTTAVSARSAKLLAAEMPPLEPAVLSRLDRYDHVGSVTVGGRVSGGFRVRGLECSAVYGPASDPDLSASVDANMARKPVDQVVANLATLDRRIVDHLRAPVR